MGVKKTTQWGVSPRYLHEDEEKVVTRTNAMNKYEVVIHVKDAFGTRRGACNIFDKSRVYVSSLEPFQ